MRGLAWWIGAAALVAGCAGSQERPAASVRGEAQAPQREGPPPEVWEAHLAPLNVQQARGPTTGRLRILRQGDVVDVSLDVEGAPPSMLHMQHLHGFEEGRQAQCVTISDDANGDGILDAAELPARSGTELVPLHGDPLGAELVGDGYPVADTTGAWHYRASFSFAEWQQALQQRQIEMAPERWVVYLHGIYEDAALPESVGSIGDLPASRTLPIACGLLQRRSPAGGAEEAPAEQRR